MREIHTPRAPVSPSPVHAQATRRERELLAEQRTSRKRAKRQKKKAKKAKTGPDAGGKAGEGAKESSSSEDEDALPAAALD